jgi:lipopolysaccharide export LptBFGC system permease protein LptF
LRIQRYILGLLAKNFLLVLVAVTALAFLGAMGQTVGQYAEVSLSLLLKRFPYLLPVTLSKALPLAILVSTLITYGRLSADNEILAVKMGGIHPFHAISPALVLGLSVTLLALVINNSLAPDAARKAREVTTDDLRIFLDNLEEQRVTRFWSRNVTMSWHEVDEDGWLTGFFFKLRTNEDGAILGEAERARVTRDPAMTRLTFEFRDATISEGSLENRTSAKRLKLSYPVDQFFRGGKRGRRKSNIESAELRYLIHRDPVLCAALQSAAPTLEGVRKFNVEFWSRIGLSAACLVFVLVGAPLGILFRRGSLIGATLLALVLALLVYYPLMLLGDNLASEGLVPPALGLLLPGIPLSLLGVILLHRVVRR